MSEIEYVEVPVWILVDECGDIAVSDDEDHVRERWTDTIGDDHFAKSLVKLTVRVPKPRAIDAGTVTVSEPDQTGKVSVIG
ncbi:MAG: hypothetical protein EBZ50_13885 [Alphaproteobacteria bacterium]|nr:hypothetical protein [Alphaproteobacteria bacterium]